MSPQKFSKRLTPQGAESRERLLQGAIDLISERGYAATSVDAICRHAGTAKTALYWHFKSKEGLLNAIIERVNEDWITEISRSIDSIGEPAERLDQLLDALREIVETKPHCSGQALMRGIERNIGHEVPRVEMVAHTILGLLQMALVRRLVDPDTDLDLVFADLRRTIILIVSDRVNNPGIYADKADKQVSAGTSAANSPSGPSSSPTPMSMSGDRDR
jgi:AcrR family transcriptional regulator